ncbi:PLAC8 family protein isoform X2 [Wolffia australiana]
MTCRAVCIWLHGKRLLHPVISRNLLTAYIRGGRISKWAYQMPFGPHFRSCMGFFCPCILFGKNAELLGAETLVGPCLTHFILWGLVNGMCCLLTEGILIGLPGSIVAFYACGYRSSLRAKYNLQEAPCGDLATHLFCHVCALCQEYREIRERMGDPGPSDPHLAVVKPPSIQKMESDSED